jgi:hypothetical protein
MIPMDRPSEMPPARAPIRFTYEDDLGFPDDGRRHELIAGEHFVTPAPARRHQRISLQLAAALHAHLFAGFSLALDGLFAE